MTSVCMIELIFSTLPTLLRYLQGTGFKCDEAYVELSKQMKRIDQEPPVQLTPEVIAALVNGRNTNSLQDS